MSAKNDLKATLKELQEENHRLVEETRTLRTEIEQRQSDEYSNTLIQRQIPQQNRVEWNDISKTLDRAYGLCYSCHHPGHYYVHCPLKNMSVQGNDNNYFYRTDIPRSGSNFGQTLSPMVHQDPGQNEQLPSFTQSASRIEERNSRAYGGSSRSKSNYLRLQLYGKEVNAIVDSGCDVNLIPASFIKDQTMRRTNVKMTATCRYLRRDYTSISVRSAHD